MQQKQAEAGAGAGGERNRRNSQTRDDVRGCEEVSVLAASLEFSLEPISLQILRE